MKSSTRRKPRRRRISRRSHYRRTKRNKKKRRKTARRRSRLSKRGGLRVKISDAWVTNYKKIRHEAELHDRGGGRDCGACVYKFLGLPIDQAKELAALAVAQGGGVTMDDIDEKLVTLFPDVTFNWKVFDPSIGGVVFRDTLNPVFQTIRGGEVAFTLITNNYLGHFVVFGRTTKGTPFIIDTQDGRIYTGYEQIIVYLNDYRGGEIEEISILNGGPTLNTCVASGKCIIPTCDTCVGGGGGGEEDAPPRPPMGRLTTGKLVSKTWWDDESGTREQAHNEKLLRDKIAAPPYYDAGPSKHDDAMMLQFDPSRMSRLLSFAIRQQKMVWITKLLDKIGERDDASIIINSRVEGGGHGFVISGVPLIFAVLWLGGQMRIDVVQLLLLAGAQVNIRPETPEGQKGKTALELAKSMSGPFMRGSGGGGLRAPLVELLQQYANAEDLDNTIAQLVSQEAGGGN